MSAPSRPRASLAFLGASFVITAIVAHSSLAALVAAGVNLGLLIALRRAARREGFKAGKAAGRRSVLSMDGKPI